tara:strand:+ start:766 stop:906 length:141 start_codon:yes stop_codon:yes gene_type:complete
MARKFKDFVERDNQGRDLEDIVKILIKKRSCRIIKNIIDRDGDKNE